MRWRRGGRVGLGGPSDDSHDKPGLLLSPGRGIDLNFYTTYNAHYEFPDGFVLGNGGWSHSYALGLFPGPAGSLTWVNGRTARVKPFTPLGAFWQADGTPGLIRQNANQSYTLRWADGTKEHYHAIDGSPMSGLLTAIEDPNLQANRVSIQYQPGLAGEMRVASVTDTYGRVAFTFTYDDGAVALSAFSAGGGAALASSAGSGRLLAVTDFTGREVRFGYTDDGFLETVRSPLTTAFPTGKVFKYGYHDGLLNAITYPNEVAAGLDAPRIQVTYESLTLRVLSQTVGGTNGSGIAAGGTMTFEYLTRAGGAPFTRVTDRRGFITEYDFTPEGRVSTTTIYDPLRANGPFVTRFEYSPDGFTSRIEFPEGNESRWIYDTSHSRFQIANVLEEIHSPGPRGGAQAEIRIVRTYEPLFNQVATVTDPRGTDPSFVPPFGASGTTGRYTTKFFYGYQEMTAFPVAEAGWGMTAADVDINLGDLNGNGVLGDG